jgi:excisionase family DNA binding protein
MSRTSTARSAPGARNGARPDPLAVSILEAARLTSLSRSTIYTLIGTGKLRTVKVLGRNLVTYPSVKALMETGTGR